METKKAAVIGLWHLGCTVAASLASSGYEVLALDFDPKLIANLNQVILPIAEPGLTELTAQQLKKGTLKFSTDFQQLAQYTYIIIGYDTPVNDKDIPDLTVVNKAIKQIGKTAGQNSTVIIMSQVPAGTCRAYYNLLKKSLSGVEVVYNPENLRLSQAIETFLNADRQILGLSTEAAKPRMESFYQFFKNPLLFMSLESAELVKHGINSFLAMSVSFINQIADLSEAVGGNIVDVVKGLKSDSRVGQKAFLSPGLGFAGGTLGRDLRVLQNFAKKYRLSLPLISEVYKINQARKDIFLKKITARLKNLKGKNIAMLGLVYKPGTNTLRRSLALEIGKTLHKKGAKVFGFDPALTDPKAVRPVLLAADPYKAAEGADALVVVTEWPEFKQLDFARIKTAMKGRVIFDTKNILNKEELEKLGFNYYGTGV